MAPIPGQHAERQIPGLYEFLRDAQKLGPAFNKHLRISSTNIAKMLVNKAKQRAGTPQERAVAKGLYAKFDRIPTIQVSNSRAYTSKTRPNGRRAVSSKARIIDVWFGAEFGGGAHGAGNPKPRKSYGDGTTKGGGYTTQFRPHKGRTGYFFYPTVRAENRTINQMYAKAVDNALRESRVERFTPATMKMFFGGR